MPLLGHWPDDTGHKPGTLSSSRSVSLAAWSEYLSGSVGFGRAARIYAYNFWLTEGLAQYIKPQRNKGEIARDARMLA